MLNFRFPPPLLDLRCTDEEIDLFTPPKNPVQPVSVRRPATFFTAVPLTRRYYTFKLEMDVYANVFSAAAHHSRQFIDMDAHDLPFMLINGQGRPPLIDRATASTIETLPIMPKTMPTCTRQQAVTDIEQLSSTTTDLSQFFVSPRSSLQLNARCSQLGTLPAVKQQAEDAKFVRYFKITATKERAMDEVDYAIVFSWMRIVAAHMYDRWSKNRHVDGVLYFDGECLFKAMHLFIRLMNSPHFMFDGQSVPAIAAVCMSLHTQMWRNASLCNPEEGAVVPTYFDGLLAYMAQVHTSDLLFVEQFVLRALNEDQLDSTVTSLHRYLIKFSSLAEYINNPLFDTDFYWDLVDQVLFHYVLPQQAWHQMYFLFDPCEVSVTPFMQQDIDRTHLLLFSIPMVVKQHSVHFAKALDLAIERLQLVKDAHLSQDVDLVSGFPVDMAEEPSTPPSYSSSSNASSPGGIEMDDGVQRFLEFISSPRILAMQ